MKTPFFGAEIEIHGHHLAQPDKGTGAAMVCTFGDVTDIIWWRELRTTDNESLPNMTTIAWTGDSCPMPPPPSRAPRRRPGTARRSRAKTVFSARKAIVEKLQATGDMTAVGKPFNHAVKFFEKGDRPLEIVSTRQWYIRNGARDGELRDKLIAHGEELAWHPEFMRVRYENWVGGLTGDWLVSRQRFFGVPIPLWYALDENGERDYDRVLTPGCGDAPDRPDHRCARRIHRGPARRGGRLRRRGRHPRHLGDLVPHPAARGVAGSATRSSGSSLLRSSDLRPQGQDIIRTWLFSTMLRSTLEDGRTPWRNAAISGFIVDPDRKKMSKVERATWSPRPTCSRPTAPNAVRYWAASSRLGMDAAFRPAEPDAGEDRSPSGHQGTERGEVRAVVPRARGCAGDSRPRRVDADALDSVVVEATKAFERYDAARALELTEAFFWTFCDDYLELVKERAYKPGRCGTLPSRGALAASGPVDAAPPAGSGAVLRGRGIVVLVRRGLRAHGRVADAARHRRRPGGAGCSQ